MIFNNNNVESDNFPVVVNFHLIDKNNDTSLSMGPYVAEKGETVDNAPQTV